MTPATHRVDHGVEESRPIEPDSSVRSIFRTSGDRCSRAERLERSDVPWVTSVKLAWGLEVRLLNISSTGLLLETGTKLTPGSVTEVKLCGPDTDISIPVRFVRSEVADAHHMGITYHTAATFEKPLPALYVSGEESPSSRLSRLLALVSAELTVESHPSLAAALEEGVRRALNACEVRIDAAPFLLNDDRHSVAVTIPTSTVPPATLQARFEPGSQPSDLDLKVLTAAAGLASVILEFGER